MITKQKLILLSTERQSQLRMTPRILCVRVVFLLLWLSWLCFHFCMASLSLQPWLWPGPARARFFLCLSAFFCEVLRLPPKDMQLDQCVDSCLTFPNNFLGCWCWMCEMYPGLSDDSIASWWIDPYHWPVMPVHQTQGCRRRQIAKSEDCRHWHQSFNRGNSVQPQG